MSKIFFCHQVGWHVIRLASLHAVLLWKFELLPSGSGKVWQKQAGFAVVLWVGLGARGPLAIMQLTDWQRSNIGIQIVCSGLPAVPFMTTSNTSKLSAPLEPAITGWNVKSKDRVPTSSSAAMISLGELKSISASNYKQTSKLGHACIARGDALFSLL